GVDVHRHLLVRAEARTGRDEAAHDDVLLQTAQVVDLALDGSLGEHLGGLLERRRRDERLGRQRRLGDAEQQRLALGRRSALLQHALVLLLEDVTLDLLVDEEVGVADVGDANAAQHLTNDRLDVLVVDLDALESVDLLDFVDQVLRQRLLAEHLQDVVRVGGAVHQRLAGAHAIALADAQVLALRDQVLLGLADFRRDDHLALALGVLAERDDAVDLGDDRVLLRLARFEQLGDARQTAGDVLGLGGLARDLGDDVARLDGVAVVDVDVRADRQEVTRLLRRARDLLGLAVLVLDRDTRTSVGVLRLDDDLAREAGDLVELLLHRHLVDDVAVLQDAGDLGEDRHRERIPLRQQRLRGNLLPFLDEDLGAVGQRITLALAARVVGEDELAVAVHRHEVALLGHDLQVLELHVTFVARLERRLLGADLADAADVERTHRQLRARLADRLRGDDADRFADVDDMAAREVATVAGHADAAAGLAGEHRTDAHFVDAGRIDLADLVLVDLLVLLDEHFARIRVDNVLERHAAEDTVAELLDDLAALDERGHLDAFHRAAIEVGHDGVLGDVDETARQVARVGGLERRVGEALTSAVGRDEVLENREAFTEVRGDRRLDDFARRLGHEATHAGQLLDLLGRATRARVGHDEDRVERRRLLLFAGVLVLDDLRADLVHHLLGDALGNLGPDIDHLVVALAVGDEALGVLLLDLRDFLGCRRQLAVLGVGDLHVVDADRDAGHRRVGVPEGTELVGEEDRLLLAALAVAGVDQIGELLLAHGAVDVLEGDALRRRVPEQDAARRGVGHDALAVEVDDAALDLGLQVDLTVVERHTHFFGRREQARGALALLQLRRGQLAELALRERAVARHVVQAEDDVLRRDDDRLTVRGAQDVVGRHHEDARFHLRLDRQRHVHRHLIAVEVGVERRADERVHLDRLALDQHRLERLDAETVQRRSAVQQNRVLLDDVFEDVPHLGTLLLDELLGALDRGDQAALFELVVDERLEQLERHLLRQAALVQLELGAD